MDTSAGSQHLDVSDSEVEYGSDHEREEDNCVVEFFLEVKEKGNRFGVIKVKKNADNSKETFQAMSNFIINITGEVRAGVHPIEGTSLSGYICEVIYHNGNTLGYVVKCCMLLLLFCVSI